MRPWLKWTLGFLAVAAGAFFLNDSTRNLEALSAILAFSKRIVAFFVALTTLAAKEQGDSMVVIEKACAFGLLFLSIASAQEYTLGGPGALTPSEDSLLSADGALEKVAPVPGWVMPLLNFYRVIDAQPSEVAAIYFDVKRHPEYFPDIISVEVESTSGPSKLVLGFKQRVFLFIKDKSRVENEFTYADQAYFLRWHILESQGAEKGDGVISFRPYRGKTLMRYAVLVQPKSFLMRYSFIRNRAIRRMSDVLTQTQRAVAKVKAERPELLKAQMLATAQMLGHGQRGP